MRVVPFCISLASTLFLIFLLNNSWGVLPPLGRFLSPQHGFWRNAEPLDESFSSVLKFPGINNKADVYFDDRLIPHVMAANTADAFFIQGYLHAKFRLWQMEFQVFAAGGRLSEVLGAGPNNGYLNHDREMRRLGMVENAKTALAAIERDPETRAICDAYTAGVNAYIDQLKESDLPLEYKLLNYQPEKWTNLKIAIFLKYMSYELSGSDDDFEMTNAKAVFSQNDFNLLYPSVQDSLDPIVPKGTVFPAAARIPVPPAAVDSLYLNNTDSVLVKEFKPDKDNGSNNWAVSGKKTKSGRPILCNDPHLGTNLPAIWFEMQLQTDSFNTYGVSFPGAPFIIIGFNDSCAWGVTTTGRDVRDYYTVRFRDASKKQYWYNGAWRDAGQRVDTIYVKGEDPFYDTVSLTHFGPVAYDNNFSGSSKLSNSKYYAVHWKAADSSNELATFIKLATAKNYQDYRDAISNLHNPGQNFIFASKAGDIAIWQQGEFPAKWKQQGEFVMPGEDSSFEWQGLIPQDENPHLLNPERGFVSSANQSPADTAYPYFLDSKYSIYRGLIINRFLKQPDSSFTPEIMMKMQTENYNVFAEMARPLLLRNMMDSGLTNEEKSYLEIFRAWNLRNDPEEKGPTVFKIWWTLLEKEVYDDEFSKQDLPLMRPFESTLLEALLKDPDYKFVDNLNTPAKESLPDVVTASFKKAVAQLSEEEKEGKLEWARYKDTWVRHLLRIPALSRQHVPIGGGTHCINAAKQFHGPSWRMIVQLTDKTEAYGIYPGGQSGNPGSPYYDNFIDNWSAGRYYPLWVMAKGDENDNRVKWKLQFEK